MKEQDKDVYIFLRIIGVIGGLSLYSIFLTLIVLVWIQNVFIFKLLLTEFLVFVFSIFAIYIIKNNN